MMMTIVTTVIAAGDYVPGGNNSKKWSNGSKEREDREVMLFKEVINQGKPCW